MTCTKAPKKQAIFRIFSPISGIFRGYCKTLSTKTRIVTGWFRPSSSMLFHCKTLSTKTRIVTISGLLLQHHTFIAKHCPLKQGL